MKQIYVGWVKRSAPNEHLKRYWLIHFTLSTISSAFLAALPAWQLLNMTMVFLAELAKFFMSDTKMKKELPQRHGNTK